MIGLNNVKQLFCNLREFYFHLVAVPEKYRGTWKKEETHKKKKGHCPTEGHQHVTSEAVSASQEKSNDNQKDNFINSKEIKS